MELDTRGPQASRDSEQSYRRFLEPDQDGIPILGADSGRIQDANPFPLQLLHYCFVEVVGKTVSELTSLKDLMPNHVLLQSLKELEMKKISKLPIEGRVLKEVLSPMRGVARLSGGFSACSNAKPC